MCGIAGFWQQTGPEPTRGEWDAMAAAMGRSLAHRGPDAGAEYVDRSCGLALAHRRLSILDLSPTGAQPMISPSGRYVLILNGEIYNFAELRCELASKFQFRGHADTEILLAAIETWGLQMALRKSVGMFALALWDRQERVLQLARDRMGEKPLYYAHEGGLWLFGSELKALTAHPRYRPSLNSCALQEFVRFGYIPWPLSIYEGCAKLPPGCMLTVTAKAAAEPEPQPYWELAEVVRREPGGVLDEATAVAQLESHLREAIAGQMVADVPVGAFLSGGIDSSAVVALMQSLSSRPVKTFTIGFAEQAFDESKHARAIAQYLGTEHTQLDVTPREALDLIPRLPSIYDEPFADSSQIPTCLVASLARQAVTVSLSGDGGDELFVGYGRYLKLQQVWRVAGRMPGWSRALAGWGLQTVDAVARSRTGGDAASKLAALLRATSRWQAHRATLSQYTQPGKLLMTSAPQGDPLRPCPSAGKHLVEDLMYYDCLTYLPDDILVKVDRAAMAVGLETRVPMLDYRLVGFAWQLPYAWKFRQGQGKWLLRQVLKRYVPPALFERPKQGFQLPVGAWLRGSLRDWASDLLAPELLRRQGHFRVSTVQKLWAQHLKGVDQTNRLWILLMFQAWLQAWPARPASGSLASGAS